MVLGVSIPMNRKRIFDRVIIPGLNPSNISSVVSLGMNRPEWIKYIITSVIHNEYDLSSTSDLTNLIFNEKSGLLIQSFKWKKEAIDRKFKSSAGYGIGFTQIKERVLSSNYTVEYLITDYLNDLITNLNSDTVQDYVDDLNIILNNNIDKEALYEKVIQLKDIPKFGINEVMALYSWMIKQSLRKLGEDVVTFFSIANIYVDIINNLFQTEPYDLDIYKNIFIREKPGFNSIKLNKYEIAILLHELLKNDKLKPISLSYILVYTMGDKFNVDDMDYVFKNSYELLPKNATIKEKIMEIYNKISKLYLEYGSEKELLSFNEFYAMCNVEDIKNIAIQWEYNLIAGDIEEVLRRFIYSESDPPYSFSYDNKWIEYLEDEDSYVEMKTEIDLFKKFLSKSISYADYSYIFNTTIINENNLLTWSSTIYDHIKKSHDYKKTLYLLLKYSEENGNILEFKNDMVHVFRRPVPINPLIARGAIYDWIKLFTNLWN